MRGQHIEAVERCTECHLHSRDFFCALSPETVRAFEAVKRTHIYPRGAALFIEGQSPDGIYVLCQGRVKISTSTSDGRTLILRIVEPGEALGLSAIMTGIPYQVTAEALEPCQANFVEREEFTQLLSRHKDACFNVARHLSRYCHHAYAQIRTLGLSNSATEKLAQLLLDRCAKDGVESEQGLQLKMFLTQEELAGMIGTSRETVSRVFGELKSKQIIKTKGSAITIIDKPALEKIARG